MGVSLEERQMVFPDPVVVNADPVKFLKLGERRNRGQIVMTQIQPFQIREMLKIRDGLQKIGLKK